MVEIVSCHTFTKVKDKNGNEVLKPRIVRYKRTYDRVGRPYSPDVTDEKRQIIIDMVNSPYKLPYAEMSRQSGLSVYLVKKVIAEI